MSTLFNIKMHSLYFSLYVIKITIRWMMSFNVGCKFWKATADINKV